TIAAPAARSSFPARQPLTAAAPRPLRSTRTRCCASTASTQRTTPACFHEARLCRSVACHVDQNAAFFSGAPSLRDHCGSCRESPAFSVGRQGTAQEYGRRTRHRPIRQDEAFAGIHTGRAPAGAACRENGVHL